MEEIMQMRNVYVVYIVWPFRNMPFKDLTIKRNKIYHSISSRFVLVPSNFNNFNINVIMFYIFKINNLSPAARLFFFHIKTTEYLYKLVEICRFINEDRKTI